MVNDDKTRNAVFVLKKKLNNRQKVVAKMFLLVSPFISFKYVKKF